MIIEQVTESDLQTELKNRIGDPLHLNNTYFEWSLDIHDRVANLWWEGENYIDFHKTGAWSATWAQDNIISTAEDIAIWAKSLFEAKVINQESLNQMLTFVPGSYLGLGVQKVSLSGRELWGHIGALGYQTIVAYSSVDSVSIAILANGDMPVVTTLEVLLDVILSTAVEENEVNSPISYTLKPNYPNPFNPWTTINYSLAKDSHVKLTIYNTLGQMVDVLVNGFQSRGFYTMKWNAKNLPSGLYIYRLEADGFSAAKKMFLQK